MPEPDFTAQNKALFDQVAPTYDQLSFLRLAALAFAEQVPVQAGMRVLDLTTGTGEVAHALAKRGAQVTGVDLSPQMIEAANQKYNLPNLNFTVADAAALPFPDRSFDLVTCAAGLFFIPDMLAALTEWKRVLKAGGKLHFTSFGRGLLGDLPGLWREELAGYGLRPGSPPLGRIPTPEAAAQLLQEAGFAAVSAAISPLPYALPHAQARWKDIEAGLEGAVLGTLDQATRQELRSRHQARLSALSWPQKVSLPLITAQGRKEGLNVEAS